MSPCPWCTGTGTGRSDHTSDGLCNFCSGSGKRSRVDYSDNDPQVTRDGSNCKGTL